MPPDRKDRNYEISGSLQPGQWELFESTLERLGIDFSLKQPKPSRPKRYETDYANIASNIVPFLTPPLNSKDFHQLARSRDEFSRQLAGRSWNLLTRIYAYQFFEGQRYLPDIPEDFRDTPLEFEDVPDRQTRDSIYVYAKKLGGLSIESLDRFLVFVDDKIEKAGDIKEAELPEGTGPNMIGFLHVVSAATIKPAT